MHVERACGLRTWTLESSSGARTLTVPLGTRGVAGASLGDPRLARTALTIFLHDGAPWLAASPRARVSVDGVPVPTQVRAFAPVALRIGSGGQATAATLDVDRTDARLLVRFGRRLAPAAWPLAARGGTRAVWRVSGATDGVETQPGTLPRLAPGIEAPLGPRGGAERRYDGALEWSGSAWRWHVAGRTRTLGLDAEQRLPGLAADERGHLLRLSSADQTANPLPLLSAFWLLGALLLAVDAARGSGEARGLRVALVGTAYTLLAARVILAVRVTRAAPFSDEAVPTTLVLLAAFPLLAWLLARWSALPGFGPRLAPAWRALRAGLGAGGEGARAQARVWALPAGALLLVAGTAVAVWIGAGGFDRAAFAVLVPFVGGAGLIGLHRVLVPSLAQDAARATPLGFLAPHSDFGFGRRHLARSVLALLVLVALYVALVLAPRGLSTVASLAAYVAAVVWVHVFVRERALLRPRIATARALQLAGIAAGVGAAVGVLASLLARPTGGVGAIVGSMALGATLTLGAAAAALWPRVRTLRAWPYRARDVLPPRGYVLLPAALLLVSAGVSVSRLGITLGFAVACAALLLVVRVVTVLWYAETRARALAATPPRQLEWWIVLAALSVYGGYLAADRGLVLLLMIAVLTTVVFGAATLGGRRLIGAIALLAGVVGVVAYALHAPLRHLPDPATHLATPQMRYAAVHAPAAMQAQALVARTADAREIISTLQQDWGMRAYAALGGTLGRGLYGVPYVPRAISPDVALTDNVFALWILAEHGFAGAAALLGVYLTLAGVLLLAAAQATRRYSGVHRAILLGGLAAYLLTPALYMAAANASLLPLTGQNLPGLGLRSGADAAFLAWLLALALTALPGDADDAPRDYLETRASEGALPPRAPRAGRDRGRRGAAHDGRRRRGLARDARRARPVRARCDGRRAAGGRRARRRRRGGRHARDRARRRGSRGLHRRRLPARARDAEQRLRGRSRRAAIALRGPRTVAAGGRVDGARGRSGLPRDVAARRGELARVARRPSGSRAAAGGRAAGRALRRGRAGDRRELHRRRRAPRPCDRAAVWGRGPAPRAPGRRTPRAGDRAARRRRARLAAHGRHRGVRGRRDVRRGRGAARRLRLRALAQRRDGTRDAGRHAHAARVARLVALARAARAARRRRGGRGRADDRARGGHARSHAERRDPGAGGRAVRDGGGRAGCGSARSCSSTRRRATSSRSRRGSGRASVRAATSRWMRTSARPVARRR